MRYAAKIGLAIAGMLMDSAFNSPAMSRLTMLPPMPDLGNRPSRAAPRDYAKRTSRYMPHQGERECARRVRQMARAAQP